MLSWAKFWFGPACCGVSFPGSVSQEEVEISLSVELAYETGWEWGGELRVQPLRSRRRCIFVRSPCINTQHSDGPLLPRGAHLHVLHTQNPPAGVLIMPLCSDTSLSRGRGPESLFPLVLSREFP